jgi:hypothetical protein
MRKIFGPMRDEESEWVGRYDYNQNDEVMGAWDGQNMQHD